jgi:hypothetical protein
MQTNGRTVRAARPPGRSGWVWEAEMGIGDATFRLQRQLHRFVRFAATGRPALSCSMWHWWSGAGIGIKKKKLFVNHDSRPAGHHVPSFTEMKNIYEIGATMCVMISSNGRCTHGRRVEPKRTLCSTAKVLSGAFRVVPLQLPTVVAFSPVPWKPRHASRRYFFLGKASRRYWPLLCIFRSWEAHAKPILRTSTQKPKFF